MMDEEKVTQQESTNEEVKVEETKTQEEVKEEVVKAAETPAQETKSKKSKAKTPKPNYVEDEATLSDEELYAKIETEKALKHKKTTKIASTISLAVVLVVAILFICLATIPLNLTPVYLKSDYVAYVHIGNSSSSKSGTLSTETNSDEYENLKNLISDTFTGSTLSALFGGKLGNYTFNETPNSGGSMTKDTFLTTYTSFVRFVFDDEQTLVNKNGSNYTSTRNSRTSFTFTELYLILSDTEGDTTADFFAVVQSTSSSTEYVIQFTTIGDTYLIYEYFE